MADAMKIMAVSDRVMENLYVSNLREKYPDIELLIGCGDLPFYYLEFLVSALDAPMVYVRGNHDGGVQYTTDGRRLTSVQGGVDIHGRALMVNNLLLAGLEGSMRYRPNADLMYTEAEMIAQAAKLLPSLLWNKQRYGRALDILVAHSPPWRIHDGRDLPHTGFKIFRTLLTYLKPRYLLHGHMHIYRQDTVRVTQFVETTVMNVYPYLLFNYMA